MPHNSVEPNRLIDEVSPYLLQHAHNPVRWYPWGEEALNKAKAEDKPIFLSIGYSACHWCHVRKGDRAHSIGRLQGTDDDRATASTRPSWSCKG